MYVDKIDSRKKRGRKKNWASLLETAWKKTRKAGGEEKSEKARFSGERERSGSFRR
jgi:hypothetical protein